MRRHRARQLQCGANEWSPSYGPQRLQMRGVAREDRPGIKGTVNPFFNPTPPAQACAFYPMKSSQPIRTTLGIPVPPPSTRKESSRRLFPSLLIAATVAVSSVHAQTAAPVPAEPAMDEVVVLSPFEVTSGTEKSSLRRAQPAVGGIGPITMKRDSCGPRVKGRAMLPVAFAAPSTG